MATLKPMLSHVLVAASPDFSVAAVRCAGHRSGWSAPEPTYGHTVVLVRAGRFRLRLDGQDVRPDRAMGYLQLPGEEASFAHPAGGDVCTAIGFSPGLWQDVAGDVPGPASRSVHVDGRLDLAHRRLLRAAPDVSFGMTEQLLGLLTGVLRRSGGRERPAPRRRARTLADDAREALVSGHPGTAGLVPLARLLAVSPSHLSRVFRRETGISLTRYRNRLRAGRALDHIEQGADNLAELAAALGFADQAHLCRTVKAELGHTPTELRRLLGP